jgi:hypothetical protein
MDSEELIISPDYHIGQCFACLKCLHCFKLWNAENEEADRCSCPINQKPPTKDTYTRTIEPKMTGMGMAWVRKKDDANDWGSDFTRPFNISLCGRDNSAYQRALKADDNYIPSKRGRKCKDTLQALNTPQTVSSIDSNPSSTFLDVDNGYFEHNVLNFTLVIRIQYDDKVRKDLPGKALQTHRTVIYDRFRLLIEEDIPQLKGKDWSMIWKAPRGIEMGLENNRELEGFLKKLESGQQLLVIATYNDIPSAKMIPKRGRKVFTANDEFLLSYRCTHPQLQEY